MTEQHEIYNISSQDDIRGLIIQLNNIFALLSNRLDQIEGLRGTPQFYTDNFEYPTSDLSGQLTGSGTTASFGGLTSADISDLGTIATQDADSIDISGGDLQTVNIYNESVIYQSYVKIYDANNTCIHQFPIDFLAQTSSWFGFY